MQNLGFLIDGGSVFGGIAVGVDALSLWFMAIICLVFVAGALYGTDYMEHYLEHSRALVLHIVSYVVCFLSMLALCVLRNALAFLVALILVLLGVKKLVNSKRTIASGPTWGCGYTAATPRIQYTATSFVKTYADMFTGLLGFHKEYKPVEGIYPQERGSWESENYDRIETGLIERPLGAYRRLMDRFSFLQNGHLQMYILYGIICIVVTILLTFIFV